MSFPLKVPYQPRWRSEVRRVRFGAIRVIRALLVRLPRLHLAPHRLTWLGIAVTTMPISLAQNLIGQRRPSNCHPLADTQFVATALIHDTLHSKSKRVFLNRCHA